MIQGDYCDIRSQGEASPLTCCVAKSGATGNPWKGNGKKRSAAAIQDAGLVDLKQARPWFKSIESDVLQRNADCIIMEDLSVSNMMRRCKVKTDSKGRFLPNGQSAKRGLNRSIADASWGDLTSKIEYTAAKSGKIVLKVNPKHTSMTCSKCGHIDKASRNQEKFICTSCGHIAHADKQAAINIRNRGIERYEIF